MPILSEHFTSGIASEILEGRYGVIRVSEAIVNFSPQFVSNIFSAVGFLPINIVGDEKSGCRNYYGYCSKFREMVSGETTPSYNLLFGVNKSSGVAEVSVVDSDRPQPKSRR